MGPLKNSNAIPKIQGLAGGRPAPARRRRGSPEGAVVSAERMRAALPSPGHTRQHYCGQGCREAARQWSQWKAQQCYREKAAGKRKRNGQSTLGACASRSLRVNESLLRLEGSDGSAADTLIWQMLAREQGEWRDNLPMRVGEFDVCGPP